MVKTVEQLIDEALVRKPHEPSGKWTPSNFGRCFRLQYWRRKAEPQTNPVGERTLRVFRCGNLFEQFVKDLIIKDGNGWVDCGDEPIESDDVLGYADLKRDNEIADVKSQHSKSFWWVDKEIKAGGGIEEIKYPNWLQVMYYVRESNKDFGRLIFVSKDDLCIQEYVQPLDEYWRAQLTYELVVLRAHWDAQALPPAKARAFGGKENKVTRPKKSPYYDHPKECSYCAWFERCKEIESNNAPTNS